MLPIEKFISSQASPALGQFFSIGGPILVAKSSFFPLTLTLSPVGGRGDKRKELLAERLWCPPLAAHTQVRPYG